MAIAQKVAGIPKLVKLEYSVFVLPFTYIGMLLAGNATIVKLVLITIALIALRCVAFASNRYIGRDVDAKNPAKKSWVSVRTYSKNEMLAILIAFVAVFLLCAYGLNTLALELAPFVLVVMVLEPYVKAYTAHRHFTMGLAIGLGILGGYIGASGMFPTTLPLYVLLVGYALFSGANDIVLSLSHMKFDKAHGIKTYPQRYGKEKALRYELRAHMLASFFFVVFGLLLHSVLVAAAAAITIPIFIIEHIRAKYGSPTSLSKTFLYYNAAVTLLMLLAVILFVYL